eukprot:6317-Heterococcus_DN1.PRE.3
MGKLLTGSIGAAADSLLESAGCFPARQRCCQRPVLWAWPAGSVCVKKVRVRERKIRKVSARWIAESEALLCTARAAQLSCIVARLKVRGSDADRLQHGSNAGQARPAAAHNKDHESVLAYCGNSSSKEGSVAGRATGDDLTEHSGGSCELRAMRGGVSSASEKIQIFAEAFHPLLNTMVLVAAATALQEYIEHSMKHPTASRCYRCNCIFDNNTL